jgi:threonine aldolase
VIDLRTDAISRPTDEMWAAMHAADVGWAYVGEDAAVNELSRLGAELLGKEVALLLPTCSAANLVALMTLGTAGGDILLDPTCHVATSEARGFETICGLVERPIVIRNGCPDPDGIDVACAAATRPAVLCLENTHNNAGGVAVPPSRLAAAAAAARGHGARVHLDGARLFNAAVALGMPASRLTEGADTVSLSLGKGLCAPGGALLAGSRDVIDRARLAAQRIGARSLHKAGVIAAAGIVALKSMIDRLHEDHRRARMLAEALAGVSALGVDLGSVQTNIVTVDVRPPLDADTLLARLLRRRVLGYKRSATRVRFVTHRTIGDAQIAEAITTIVDSV